MTDEQQFPEDMPESIRRFLEELNNKADDPESPMMGAFAFDMNTGELTGAEGMPDEIKEMIPELISGQLGERLMSSHVHNDWAETTRPSQMQLNMEPGDWFLISEVTFDSNDLTVGSLLDPVHYAVQFPNWEERLLTGHRLTTYRSHLVEDESIGWFPLVSMVPLYTEAEVAEAETWRKQGHIETDFVVWWLFDRYLKGLYGMMEANNDRIPIMSVCVKCGSENVYFETTITRTHRLFVGVDPDDEKFVDEKGRYLKYNAYSKYNQGGKTDNFIRCVDCGNKDDLYARGAAIYLDQDLIYDTGVTTN